jgi:hypothetical protein
MVLRCLRRQCDRYLNPSQNGTTSKSAWWIETDAPCFERAGVPAAQQLSNIPEESEKGVMYYRRNKTASRQEVSPAPGRWGMACSASLVHGRASIIF